MSSTACYGDSFTHLHVDDVRISQEAHLRAMNAVLWNVTPCGSCNYQRFGGTYRFRNQSGNNRRARNSVCLLLVAR
jgi:hypothetical protein